MSGDQITILIEQCRSCKFSLIPRNISDDEVHTLWNSVSQFVAKNLLQNKAVNLPGLGLFSLQCRTLDLGNNGKLSATRPIFVLSEKFATTYGVIYPKVHASGDIPVVPLNYAVISVETGFSRDTVETCFKELLGGFSRNISSQKNGELSFRDLGRLVVKESKAKMKFCKEFLKSMGGPGLFNPLSGARPTTSGSFLSRSSVMSVNKRPLLPRIPACGEDSIDRPPSVISNNGEQLVLLPIVEEVKEDYVMPCVSKWDCIPETKHRKAKTDLKPVEKIEKILEGCETEPAANLETGKEECCDAKENCCKHNSGQELCYLCHQRQRKNIPISFKEQRERSEHAQDRILQQFQQLRDQEYYEKEKRQMATERNISHDVALFNLTTAENLKKGRSGPAEFHHSYVFNCRVPSPQRFLSRDEYCQALGDQVQSRGSRNRKLKSLTQKLERLEQSNLATELADTKKRHLKTKQSNTQRYQTALHYQVNNPPFRLPKAEPDSNGPIFGKLDQTPEKIRDIRDRARGVLDHQLKTIQERKDKTKSLKDAKRRYEREVLQRTKRELREDVLKKLDVQSEVRKELEESWETQKVDKSDRDMSDITHQMTAGLLLLDQCDKYSRCNQCKRCCKNIGTSNVWRESRYISGSRLMV